MSLRAPRIPVTENHSVDVLRPSEAGPRAFVLSEASEHPNKIQTIYLKPGRYYQFTFTPSTTNDQLDQLYVTEHLTAELSQPPERSVTLSCWPLHREETGYSHLNLQLMSQKRASDGAGQFFEFAYGVELSKNLHNDDVSHATAIVYVQRDGTIDGADPDHLLQWFLPIDGEGTTARPLPPTIPTERHRLRH